MKTKIRFFSTVLLSCIFLSLLSCKNTKINPDGSKDYLITEKTSKADDTQYLSGLYDEILKLAKNQSCINSSSFKFTGLGIKACGGFNTYVIYSQSINEKSFLEKVDLYNTQNKKYNEKHSIVSDCALLLPPSKIECKEGKPSFVYQ